MICLGVFEMKKYKAYFGYSVSLEEVECDRETENSVWINGGRRAKIGERETFHDTFEQAKEMLIMRASRELESARSTLQRAQDKLGNIKGMKP